MADLEVVRFALSGLFFQTALQSKKTLTFFPHRLQRPKNSMEAPNQFPDQASYQTSYQTPNHNSSYPNHIPYQHQNYAPNQPLQNPPKLGQKYYKPIATRRPILSLFFLASLIFLAGLEYVLRRGIPVPSEVISTPGTVHRRMLSEPTSIYSSNWTSYENTPSSTTPPMQIPSCIGIEIIISVTAVEHCSTAIPDSAGKSVLPASHLIDVEHCAKSFIQVSCVTTTGQSTYQKPIFNTPLPTMPCYICAMQQQGIETSGWITATTVSFSSSLPAFVFHIELNLWDRLNVRPVIHRALPLSTLVRLVRVQSSQKRLCGRLHQHGRPNLTPPTSSTHINTRIRLGLRKPQRFRLLPIWFVR